MTETPPRGLTWLLALTRVGKPVYEGTANREQVRRRRAKNKVARASRRKNR